jgi:putative aldouronate transport system substrate-binding protein
MKKSYCKLMKSITLGALALATTLTFGCSSTPKEVVSEDTGTKEVASEGSGTKETVSEEKSEAKTEISIALWDLQDFGKDELGQAIEDKLNVKIKEFNLSWDTGDEQTKLFASSGDMPDCVSTYTVSDPTRFYGWINQGVTRDIPEELINKYPYVKQVFQNSPVAEAVKQITGKYYFIPRPESAKNIHIAAQSGLYYRKDWAQNVGITKEPETMDELYTMLKAFKEKDPDKNGKNDTIGMTMDKMHTELFASFGVNPGFWIEEDGKWIPGYMSIKNIDALKFYQKLYREGILDPEFTKNGYKEAIGKLAKNTAGVMLRNADNTWLHRTINLYFGDANKDKNPLDVLGVMAPVKKDASSAASWPQFISTCGTEISSKVSDEKLDKILELDNFLLSPEGKDLMRWGFEGKTYNKEDGGKKYVSLLGEGETLFKKYPSQIFFTFSDWDFDFFAENSPEISPEILKLGEETRNRYNPVSRKERLDVTYLSTPAKDSTIITWGDTFMQIITGPEDVDTAFKKFLEDCNSRGIEQAIVEVNEKVK